MKIHLYDCIDKGLYLIQARNFELAVFNKDKDGFTGIRCKFGCEFLFTEYHYDTGPPFGTVFPQEYLEQCPIDNIEEHVIEDSKRITNPQLFAWLKQKAEAHVCKLKSDHIGYNKCTKEQTILFREAIGTEIFKEEI